MTAILTRVARDNSPVVFIADSLKDGQITAWTGGSATKTVGVDYYQQTRPLSKEDSEHLRKRYAKAMGEAVENVFVRERLPRVYQPRPSIFAKGAAPQEQAQEPKRGRSEAARAQFEKDLQATAQPEPTGTAPTGDDAGLAALQEQMKDPRFAALVLKVAEILKPAL